MKTFQLSDILAMDREYRRSFVNSIQGYKTPWLVGTKGKNKVENLAIFNSIFHLGANPPLLGLVSRPPVVPRNTLTNILANNKFTLNLISRSFYKEAHFTCINWDDNISEFEQVELTPQYLEGFDVPFVAESPVQIGLELTQNFQVKNGCVILVGEVKFINVDPHIIDENGFVNLHIKDVVAIQGTEAYFETSLIEKIKYKSHKNLKQE